MSDGLSGLTKRKEDMDKQVAKAALELIKRTQLQGSEVEAYVAVVNALQDILNREEVENEQP
jgi:hypothetical protein